MRSSATLSRATHLDTRRRARHRRRACNTLAQVSRRRVRHSCRATVSTLECARLRDWVDKLSRTASRTALRRTRALRSGATLRARHSGHRARRAAHSASRTARDTRTQKVPRYGAPSLAVTVLTWSACAQCALSSVSKGVSHGTGAPSESPSTLPAAQPLHTPHLMDG
jgi:hypothetical protein